VWEFGAEEEVADFVGDDEAEHVAVGELGVARDWRRDCCNRRRSKRRGRRRREGLAENVRADGAAARNDTDGKVMWPGDDGAGRRGGEKSAGSGGRS